MSLRDFKIHFVDLMICKLTPDLMSQEDGKKWMYSLKRGRWVKGSTAGGSLGFRNGEGCFFGWLCGNVAFLPNYQHFIPVSTKLTTETWSSCLSLHTNIRNKQLKDFAASVRAEASNYLLA